MSMQEIHEEPETEEAEAPVAAHDDEAEDHAEPTAVAEEADEADEDEDDGDDADDADEDDGDDADDADEAQEPEAAGEPAEAE